MAKKAEAAPDAAPDIVELLTALAGGNAPMAMDPATAMFNFGTAALLLIGKIIDTVPEAQHAENWERIGDFFALFQLPGMTPGTNPFKLPEKKR